MRAETNVFNLGSFFPSFSLSLSLACLLHYTHLCPPQFFKTDCPPSRRFAASPLALSATLGKLKKKREKNNCALSVRKKRCTFRRTCVYSRRLGVNIYLQFLEKEERGYFYVFPVYLGVITTLWYLPRSARVGGGACRTYYCLLNALARKRSIILVTHAVSGQFVFGHKWKIQVSLVCHWRSVDTHTHLDLISKSSFTVNNQPTAGNHVVFWS